MDIPTQDDTAASRPSSRDDEGESAEGEPAPADAHYWEDSFQRLVSRTCERPPDDARMRRLETKVEGVDDQLTVINTRLSRLMTMLKAGSRPPTPATSEEAVTGVTYRQADEPRRTRYTEVRDRKPEAVDTAYDRRDYAPDRKTYTRFASDTRRDIPECEESRDSDAVPRPFSRDYQPLTLEEVRDSPPRTPPRPDPPPMTSATSRVPRDTNALVLKDTDRAGREFPTGDYSSPVFYYPRTSPLVNPFAYIKYTGHGDKLHPMIFLNRFDEMRMFERISDRDSLHFFGNSLTLSAHTWWSVGCYRTYTEARAAFKHKYWGTGAQLELHQKILLGRYDERDRTSMADYVAKFSQENQLLDNPVPEREFVVALSGHFPRDVHREIRGFAIHDVESLIGALDDYEMSLRRDATRNEARGLLALPAPTTSTTAQRRTRTRATRTSLSRRPREPRADEYDVAEAQPTVVPAVEVPRAYQPRRAARSPSPRKMQVPETERPTKVESASKESRTAATAVGRKGRDRNRRARRPQTAPPAKTQPAQSQRSRSRDKTPETRERSLSAKRKTDEQMALIAVHRFYPEEADDDNRSEELVTYTFLAEVNKEGRPALPLKLVCGEHEWPTTALLDTGATISVISQEALMEFHDFLKSKNRGRTPRRGFVPMISIPKVEVAGPFGHKTSLSGYRVDLDLRLAERGGKTVRLGQTCFVASRLTRPLILGTDFMRDYLAIIAFEMSMTKSSLALTFIGSAVTTVERGPDHPPEEVVNYEIVERGPDTAKESASRALADPPPDVVREEAEARKRASVSPLSNDVVALSDEHTKALKRLLGRHARLLDGSLGRVDGYRHKIAMRSTRPRKPKNFPVPMKYRDEVKRQLVEMERLGVVRKDATEYVNPLVVVKKNNGKIRLCLDARAINETTTDDHAQPLTIEEVLARIGDRRVYSKIDINQAYWQIELEPDSRKYTGFMFEGQTYVFLRMPFGLKTAGASFTRALDLAVAQVPQLRPNLTVYLDDILLASDTYEQHFEQLDSLFGALERIGVRLNRDKCEFLANKVQFLGHDLSRTTVEMTDETKRAIAAFKRPRTKKELQSFLGLVNWDRRFVPRLSDWTRTLEDMLCKNAKFHWTVERQAAFDAVKNAFHEAETLFLIRNDLTYGLETDASLVGLGARLYQFDPERPERQYNVAYASRSLKPAERNYTTTEQEGLALAWALNKFKLVLMGRTVHVKTDHRALTFLQSCAMNSRRIARWIEFFGHFDLRIQHIPGRSNAVADSLSRNPAPTSTEQPVEIERAGETSSVAEELALVEIDPYDEIDPAQWVEWLRRSQRQDATLERLVAEHPDRYDRRDDLVRRKKDDGTTDRIVVPEAAAWKLLDKVHRHLVHFGTDKVIDFASRYFTIDNVDRIARDVVGSCEICLATKYYTRASVGAQYYDQPTETGQMVSVDLFGPLPKSYKGHKYVLVLLDLFSKHTALFPIKNQKVESIVQAIEHQYVPIRGYTPETILTDCGGQFVTARWKQFARRVGTALRRTAPYNPQSNPVERVMRELGRVLRAYAHHDHENWDAVVPRIEDVLNRTAHASTGQTPNALERDDRWIRAAPRGDERMRPRPFPRVFLPKNLQNGRLVDNDETEREERVIRARRKLTQAARNRRTQADKKEVARPYQPGDYVWRKRQRRSDALHRKSKKLFPIYEGPLLIRECPHANTYVLEWPDGRHAGVANSRVLRPHREPHLKEPSEASDSSQDDSSDGDSPNRLDEQEDASLDADTEEDHSSDSESSDRESDRQEVSSPITDVSGEDSSEYETADPDSLAEEEEFSSTESEEYLSGEEESESENLALINHRGQSTVREAKDHRRRSERTEPLVISHSAPRSRNRRNHRRRRRNRRSQRPKASVTSRGDEYGNSYEPEDYRWDDRDKRLQQIDEQDPDLFNGEFSVLEIATELHRRYVEQECAYQLYRRPEVRDYRDPTCKDTREISRGGEEIPTLRHNGGYHAHEYDYENSRYRSNDSSDYISPIFTGDPHYRREAWEEPEIDNTRPRASPYAYVGGELTDRREQRRTPPITNDATTRIEQQTTRDASDFPRTPVPPLRTHGVARGGADDSIAAETRTRARNATGSKRKRTRSRGKSRKKTAKKTRTLRTFSSPTSLPTIEEEEEEEDSSLSDDEDIPTSIREDELPALPSPPSSGRIERIASDVTGGLSMIDYLRSQYQEDQVIRENTPTNATPRDVSEVCEHIAALQRITVKTPRARRPLRRVSRHKKYRELVRDKTLSSPTRAFRWEPADEKTPETLAALGLVRVYRGSARTDGLKPKRKERSPVDASPIEVDVSPPPSHQSFDGYYTTAAEFAPVPTADREDTSPGPTTPPYTLHDYEREFRSFRRSFLLAAGPTFNGQEPKGSTIRDLGSRQNILEANRALVYGLLTRTYQNPPVPAVDMDEHPQRDTCPDSPEENTSGSDNESSKTPSDVLTYLKRLHDRRNDACHEQVQTFQDLVRQVDIISKQIEDIQRVTFVLKFLSKELAIYGTPVQPLTPEEEKDPVNRAPKIGTLSSVIGELEVRLPIQMSRQDAIAAFRSPFDKEMDPIVPEHLRKRTSPKDEAARAKDPGPSAAKPSQPTITMTSEVTVGTEEPSRPSETPATDLSTRAVRASPVPAEVTEQRHEESTPRSSSIDVGKDVPQPDQPLPIEAPVPENEERTSRPVNNKTRPRMTPVCSVTSDAQRDGKEVPAVSTVPLPGTSRSTNKAPVGKPTGESKLVEIRSKKRKRTRPPRTTGSRRAEKFANPKDALARPRDPITGKFLTVTTAANKRGKKRNRIIFSSSSEEDGREDIRTPKTTDLSKVKSLVAKRMRLRSDEIGPPVATSTPNISEKVELRTPIKLIIRPPKPGQSRIPTPSNLEDCEATSEEEVVGPTPTPAPTPNVRNTGADPDRDPLQGIELSRPTPVGGGQSAPGTPDVATAEPRGPKDHAATGAVVDDTITVRYPGTEVECVVSTNRMIKFLEELGAIPQGERN